jgi:hypothetical protein
MPFSTLPIYFLLVSFFRRAPGGAHDDTEERERMEIACGEEEAENCWERLVSRSAGKNWIGCSKTQVLH